MAAITEDYCSFDLSKLLKERGFDVECEHYFEDGKVVLAIGASNWNDSIYGGMVSASTLQMAMKWLRKVHQIFIRPNISFLYPIRYYCEIFCYGDNLKTQQDVTTENFESPEQACETAIKYCLKNFDLNNYDNN